MKKTWIITLAVLALFFLVQQTVLSVNYNQNGNSSNGDDQLSDTPTPTNTPWPTETPTPIPINCVWSNWSVCSEPCGIGTQTRYVLINESNGGHPCTGSYTQSCFIKYCPVNCVWSDWSPCSKDCGDGIKTRYILTQAAYEGQACTGSSQQTCFVTACSDIGSGGLTPGSGNTGGAVQISISLNLAPTPLLLPTFTPVPPTTIPTVMPTIISTPTTIVRPGPTHTPVPTPTLITPSPTNKPLPTPTIPIIPSSFISQQVTDEKKKTYILDTTVLTQINIVPNAFAADNAPTKQLLLPQELSQDTTPAAGGITVTLEQKKGDTFVTHQDELTVKKGNQSFTITNQPNGSITQQEQKKPSNQPGGSNASTTSTTAPQLQININNVIAQSNMGLSVDPLNGILTVQTPTGPQKVSIMPDEALGIVMVLKALDTNGKVEPSIQFVSEKGALLYRISGEKGEKLLGLFPLSIQKQILVSADTGSMVRIELPLLSQILSFFTF